MTQSLFDKLKVGDRIHGINYGIATITKRRKRGDYEIDNSGTACFAEYWELMPKRKKKAKK